MSGDRSCANKNDEISSQSILFLIDRKILCFLPQELLVISKGPSNLYRLPVFDENKTIIGPTIDEKTYDLALSGGIDQVIAIKLLKENDSTYSGYEIQGEALHRIFSAKNRLSVWGGLIDEILHLENGMETINSNPKLHSLYDRLQHLEKASTIEELDTALRNASFTEAEKNYLNSPLLDKLYRTGTSIIDNAEYSSVVEFLLGHGADIHTFGEFTLRYASENGYTETVQLLLDRNANVHSFNNYALRYASRNGHADVVQLLLDHGAKIHIFNDDPLRTASENGHIAVVQLLLNHGADVNSLNDYALRRASKNGHMIIVQLLLNHGANIHAVNDEALRYASENGHTTIVQLLLDHDANVHAANDIALRKAKENGHDDTAKLLIKHGADVSVLH